MVLAVPATAGIRELEDPGPSPSAAARPPLPSPEPPRVKVKRTRKAGTGRPSRGPSRSATREGPPPAPARPTGAYTLRAEEALRAGDTQLALDLVDRAIRMAEDRAWAFCMRARALHRRGEHSRALDAISLAISTRPGVSDFYLERALIQKALGREAGAASDMRRAMEAGLTSVAGGDDGEESPGAAPAEDEGSGDEEEPTRTSALEAAPERTSAASETVESLRRMRDRLRQANATLDRINAGTGRIAQDLNTIQGGGGPGAAPAPRATFAAVNTGFGRDKDGREALVIRCPLKVEGLQGRPGKLVAIFERPDGGLARFWLQFTPALPAIQYPDAMLAVPIREIPGQLGGSGPTCFVLQVQDGDGQVLGSSGPVCVGGRGR